MQLKKSTQPKKQKPHRKKTLPVPGDVFVDADGNLRVITLEGFDWVDFEGQEDTRGWLGNYYKPEDFPVSWMNVGFYYLGNALTDEWENG